MDQKTYFKTTLLLRSFGPEVFMLNSPSGTTPVVPAVTASRSEIDSFFENNLAACIPVTRKKKATPDTERTLHMPQAGYITTNTLSFMRTACLPVSNGAPAYPDLHATAASS